MMVIVGISRVSCTTQISATTYLQCNKQFTNLAKHKREVHEGVKHPCGQCGKQFTDKRYVAKHIRAIHEGAKDPCV